MRFLFFYILLSFSMSSYASGQSYAFAWGFGWLIGVLVTLLMIFSLIKGWKNRLIVFLLSSASGFVTGTFPHSFYENYLNYDAGLALMLAFGTTTLVLMVSILFVRLRKKA